MSKVDPSAARAALPLAIRLRYWQAGIEIALMRLLALLPLPALRWLGAGVGRLLWPLARERQLITLRNLSLCFPDKSEQERLLLAKQNFRATAIGFMETAKVWYTAPERIANWVEIEGLEHLQGASAKGKGVLLLAFHLTDLELGAVAVSHYCRLSGMYRPHADPVFEDAMRRGRERHFPLIPRDDVRGMLRWLKAGGVVWYAADQDYGPEHSVFAPFFGIPAATITATSRFAKLSGAPVVPLTHVRTRRGIRLIVHAPLASIPSADEQADATTAAQFLEQWLSAHPADYLWLHRRFKTRPPGEPSLYPKRERRHRPDEISGKRFDKIVKAGKAETLASARHAIRLLIPSAVIDRYPEGGGLSLRAASAADSERLAILDAWRQKGIVVASPRRLRCPSRRVILHRYDGVAETSALNERAVVKSLFVLHQFGAAVAAAELFITTEVSDAIVLPLTLAAPHAQPLSALERGHLLLSLNPSQHEYYQNLAAQHDRHGSI